MDRRVLAWIEDDPFERTLVRAAVTALRDDLNLHLAATGDDLFGDLRSGSGPVLRPALVVVNLETNRPGGVEVIREMKEDPSLRRIPIVGYARPCERALIGEAYGAGVNACLLKPATYGDLRRVVQGTLQFWLSAARLPDPAVRIPAYPARTRVATGTYGAC